MQKPRSLLHTKLRLPFTRPGLVLRTKLQTRIKEGLCGPLTLITAPAGFGKTTLVASFIKGCEIPVAWLSLDKNDNQAGRFLSYLIAALQEADPTIGIEAGQMLVVSPELLPEAILISLLNDLDHAGNEMVLVLDDYQCISSQAVHEQVAFLLEHCPSTFHLVIASRSDPPLPLARLRARGQTVDLRAADLRFTETEAAQFLNEIMDLSLDDHSVAVLEERTEGWIAGLQMAALSMRDRKDVAGFIEGFSGTNRYILDYLLEEVLASQPAEIQRFLLYTSIMERLTAPLCEAILGDMEIGDREFETESFSPIPYSLSSYSPCQLILEHVERSNLFLLPLDDERQWYRYHHLFADLLRSRLDQIYPGLAPKLHARSSTWYEENGLILEAIQHASLALDDERVEHLIEQNYLEMLNRKEMSGIQFWMGKLRKDLVIRRPRLCLYEAFSRSWFGQLEEATLLLIEAEKQIRSEVPTPETQALLGYHAYVKSRVTAMQGDTRRAIVYCLEARENSPDDDVGLQIEIGISLGYEYFLYGDFINASKILNEMIQLCSTVGAINNPVAAYALLARSSIIQGRLHEANDLFLKASKLIQEADGQYFGITGLVEVGIADLLCEWNDMESALVRIKQGLDFLPLWGKADDFCLTYTTLSRLYLALGNRAEAANVIEKAVHLVQTRGVFSEARGAVEAAQARLWLAQGDESSLDRWVASLEKRFYSQDPLQFEDEMAHITLVKVYIAQKRLEDAIGLLTFLEESAQSGGRQGRLIEILIFKALALQAVGDSTQAEVVLAKSLALAEPSGYVRIFLEEGEQMKKLLAQWLIHNRTSPFRDYANCLLSLFDNDLSWFSSERENVSNREDSATVSRQVLVDPLSPREIEVLHLIAQGKTNQEIARQLVVSPGTVKAHTASIYRKLDVANRTESVARARQLGILA